MISSTRARERQGALPDWRTRTAQRNTIRGSRGGRRRQSGETSLTLAREAICLHEWCKREHSRIAAPMAKTIEGRIRVAHNAWKSREKRSNPPQLKYRGIFEGVYRENVEPAFITVSLNSSEHGDEHEHQAVPSAIARSSIGAQRRRCGRASGLRTHNHLRGD